MNPTPMRCELLHVPGACNVRDVGGYIGRGGKPVNKRRFLRSGGVHDLPPEGVSAIRELGVDCIVDLRSFHETRRKPDTLMEDADIAYVHVPMLDYIQSNIAGQAAAFPESMAEMYTGLLENDKAGFGRVFQVFADPAYRTVLFHCTAGKDRTGVTAMLLLGLAGVAWEDIVEDYTHSDKLFLQPPIPGLPKSLFESRAETIEAAIDHVNTRYGGAEGYLEAVGVDGAMRARVLDKLLGDPVV